MCSAINPDCGYDNSTIILIGDVYSPNTKCWGKLCLHKNVSTSRQKRLSMSAMRVCVPGAQNSFWRSNKLLFLVVCSRGLPFWRESKINPRCYWRCLLSRQLLFQQREMRLSNISRYLFGCGKCGTWLFFSQSSLCVTRALKDNKNRQKTLFVR